MTDHRVLTRGDAEYPELLRVLAGAPERLWVRGALALAPTVALVGSRRPTPYGLRMARRLASGLARAGVTVVSGLARGIDTAAHEAALEAGGTTWAVLGSGLDRLYPAENAGLAASIVAGGGAVLSEQPPWQGPRPAFFPARNRIISGLSWAVVVVEGDPKSGSLITARWAADQGREVLAVPGPADSALSRGPLELLRAGARPAAEAEDVLALLPAWVRQPKESPHPPNGRPYEAPVRGVGGPSSDEAVPVPLWDGPDGEKILELLGSHVLSLDEIAGGTGWELPRVLAALGELEARGTLRALPGSHYGIDQN